MHILSAKLNKTDLPNLKWLSRGARKHFNFDRSLLSLRKPLVLDYSQFCSFYIWILNSSPYLCSKILESQPKARIAYEKRSHHELKGLQNSPRLLVGRGFDCFMLHLFNFIWYLIAQKTRMVARTVAGGAIHGFSLGFPRLYFLGEWSHTGYLFFGCPSPCNLYASKAENKRSSDHHDTNLAALGLLCRIYRYINLVVVCYSRYSS